jgi:hypothetical protein
MSEHEETRLRRVETIAERSEYAVFFALSADCALRSNCPLNILRRASTMNAFLDELTDVVAA